MQNVSRRDAIAHNAKQTALMVHMHRRVGTATRRVKVPRSVFPKAVETGYGNALASISDALRIAVKPLLSALPSLLASAKVSRGDAMVALRNDFDDTQFELRQALGFAIVIENPVGSIREWTQQDGTRGSTIMKFDYGFIDGVLGADGDEVDVYVAPGTPTAEDPDAWVFVINQMCPSDADVWTEFDEQKVMLGFSNEADARAAYVSQYNDARFYGGMESYRLPDFVQALWGNEDGVITRRFDADESKRARDLVTTARQRLTSLIHPSKVETIARNFAAQTSRAGKQQLQRQARAALGIDISTMDKTVPTLINHFASENVSLIESLGNNQLDTISKMVTRAFTSGTRHEELADDIEERFGMTERHARMIARDQIGKLAGQLNAARHQEIGCQGFTWNTVGDERVREEHDAIDGESFDYPDGAPGEGLPGEPVCCRCSADPDFSAILDEADDLEGDDETDATGADDDG